MVRHFGNHQLRFLLQARGSNVKNVKSLDQDSTVQYIDELVELPASLLGVRMQRVPLRYIHPQVSIYVHTNLHACVHTCIQACMRACMHACMYA